jgi:hypothetical protein
MSAVTDLELNARTTVESRGYEFVTMMRRGSYGAKVSFMRRGPAGIMSAYHSLEFCIPPEPREPAAIDAALAAAFVSDFAGFCEREAARAPEKITIRYKRTEA